jgi:hypothetical protein
VTACGTGNLGGAGIVGRLIEIPEAQAVPSGLALLAGDLLLFRATGGHVRSGGDVVEMVGAFLPAVMGEHGKVVAPQGAPNMVLFRALRPGGATIDVVTGDPWHAPQTITVGITVEP